MLRRTLALAVAFVAFDPFTAPTPGPVALRADAGAALHTRDEVYATLVGRWQGRLEYKDYKDPSRRVTLPTLLVVSRSADSTYLTLSYTYDDGPGKTVKESDRFTLDPAGKTLTWGSESDASRPSYAVRTYEAGAPGRATRLVLEGEGKDNDQPASIRTSFVIGLNKLQILKETRPSGGSAEFGFRHRYDLTRTD